MDFIGLALCKSRRRRQKLFASNSRTLHVVSKANQALRKLFQLYANVRPAKYLEGAAEMVAASILTGGGGRGGGGRQCSLKYS